ncbi:CehA/McbA family metallohydrolase [Geodermatophilus sp. CPCC 206100]|uniref:CehA/McbA family metallohydrolase n=1 Tax=Geodermatophilus sp. CPCC 206100 TaxID=3020054 RepID=UPI003B00DDB7
MCCGGDRVLDLPPAVVEMQARYRRLQETQGWGWGEESLPDFFRWARFSLLGPAFDGFAATGDWGAAVRAAVGSDVPAGLVLVTVDADGTPAVRTGPPRPGLAGSPVPVDVVVDSAAASDLVVDVAGHPVPVPAGGTGLQTVDVDPGSPTVTVRCGDRLLEVRPVAERPAATLRLRAPHCARWSVTDATGGAWFADGVPHKWDAAHRPFFHAATVEVAVPAGALHVSAARGLEYDRTEYDLDVGPGECAEVVWDAPRRCDPAAAGWYGGDLHVHLDYSGDSVLTPADAARMQAGEGLHLLHLTAGNLGGSLVYDRELLEATAGQELWSGGTTALAGLEFRNDLLGHVHGLGLTGVPALLHTGHEGSDAPWDWPPNAAACRQLRDLGGLTTYAHPVSSPLEDVAALYAPQRTVEARELVADAALGLVDTLEVGSCFDDRGAVVLWHHLLNCGLRLTATAGTDTFLSFSHGPGTASNPPGWVRVYALLGDEPLSARAFTAAVRAGRTVVTNGPWLTLEVDGAGPGAVLDRADGDRLRVRATVTGPVDRLELHGPDGVLAATGGADLVTEVPVAGGLWLTAAAHGGDDPAGAPVFATTSPVYVDADGRRTARAASARWCLAALDALAGLGTAHGRFAPDRRDQQLADLLDVVEQARAVYAPIADDPGPLRRS